MTLKPFANITCKNMTKLKFQFYDISNGPDTYISQGSCHKTAQHQDQRCLHLVANVCRFQVLVTVLEKLCQNQLFYTHTVLRIFFFPFSRQSRSCDNLLSSSNDDKLVIQLPMAIATKTRLFLSLPVSICTVQHTRDRFNTKLNKFAD